jgi:hypothetical protein
VMARYFLKSGCPKILEHDSDRLVDPTLELPSTNGKHECSLVVKPSALPDVGFPCCVGDH